MISPIPPNIDRRHFLDLSLAGILGGATSCTTTPGTPASSVTLSRNKPSALFPLYLHAVQTGAKHPLQENVDRFCALHHASRMTVRYTGHIMLARKDADLIQSSNTRGGELQFQMVYPRPRPRDYDLGYPVSATIDGKPANAESLPPIFPPPTALYLSGSGMELIYDSGIGAPLEPLTLSGHGTTIRMKKIAPVQAATLAGPVPAWQWRHTRKKANRTGQAVVTEHLTVLSSEIPGMAQSIVYRLTYDGKTTEFINVTFAGASYG